MAQALFREKWKRSAPSYCVAETVCRSEPPEQEARWPEVYEGTSASAEYPSLEEALANLTGD